MSHCVIARHARAMLLRRNHHQVRRRPDMPASRGPVACGDSCARCSHRRWRSRGSSLKIIKDGSVFDEKHFKTRARVDAETLCLLDVEQARQLMGDELVPRRSRGHVARRCHVGAGLGRVGRALLKTLKARGLKGHIPGPAI